jgi:uncharacterized membrane protein
MIVPPENQFAEFEITETTRLEAFSDGVFAIAITLLVLEIRLPSTTDTEQAGSLAPALLQLWPVYLAYITSFVTITIMWVNHHATFKTIRRADRSLLFLNAILLMSITFLNFPTAIIAEYFQKPDAQAAAMFYSGTQFVIDVLYNSLWWYVLRRSGLLDPNISTTMVRKFVRQYSISLLAYPVAFVVAFFSPQLSIVLCLAFAIYFGVIMPQRQR